MVEKQRSLGPVYEIVVHYWVVDRLAPYLELVVQKKSTLEEQKRRSDDALAVAEWEPTVVLE